MRVLVGDPNLAAVGPEGGRHYSWSFNRVGGWIGRKRVAIGVTVPAPLTLKTVPSWHVTIMSNPNVPKMVERNPVVVRCGAARPGSAKSVTAPDETLKIKAAFCDENVARGEPGRRGLRWSDSQVFFAAGTKPRKRREHRGSPVAVDRKESSVQNASHEQKIRRSGHARGIEIAGKAGE